MGIPITKGQQQSSMGRRLFGMAAPIVGGAVGGPVGAAVGGMLGSKVNGASGADAVMGGVQAGADNAMSRRQDALKQKPEVGVQDGISILEQLPQGHPLKQELGPGLLQAAMMKPVGYRG